MKPAYPMFITAETKVTLPQVSLTMGEIQTLLPICKTGIPEESRPNCAKPCKPWSALPSTRCATSRNRSAEPNRSSAITQETATMNAIVFAPRTSPEIAARQLCAEMHRRGDTPMPDPAALADALTRAACRAAENLIDNAAASYAGNLPAHRRRPRRPPRPDRGRPHHPARATVAHPARTPQRRASPCPANMARASKPGCCGPAGPTLSAARRAANSDPPPPVGARSAVMVSCPVAAALSVEEEGNMPPNASDANMQTVAQVEFYWPDLRPGRRRSISSSRRPSRMSHSARECRSTTQATRPEPSMSGCASTNCTSSPRN